MIETIAEDLLAAFSHLPLLDAYDIYQHLLDYWAESMQDDAYLIATDGWGERGAAPRDRAGEGQEQQANLARTARLPEG